jgi:O-antigen/teichoic acid export membrane protein
MDRIATSVALKGVLFAGAIAGSVVLCGSILPGVAALAILWGLVVVAYDVPTSAWLLDSSQVSRDAKICTHIRRLADAFRPRWRMDRQWRLFAVALPLGLFIAFASLNLHLPRYYIHYYCGEEELGIFVALIGVFKIFYFVQIALGQAALDRLAARYWNGARSRFLQLATGIIGIGALFGGLCVGTAALVGGPLLAVLYAPQYAEYQGVFVLLAIASAIQILANSVSYLLNSMREFRAIIVAPVSATLILLVSLGYFVPSLGLTGAAVAMLISAVSSLVVTSIMFLLYYQRTAEGRHEAGYEN